MYISPQPVKSKLWAPKLVKLYKLSIIPGSIGMTLSLKWTLRMLGRPYVPVCERCYYVTSSYIWQVSLLNRIHFHDHSINGCRVRTLQLSQNILPMFYDTHRCGRWPQKLIIWWRYWPVTDFWQYLRPIAHRPGDVTSTPPLARDARVTQSPRTFGQTTWLTLMNDREYPIFGGSFVLDIPVSYYWFWYQIKGNSA
jgi:hypothetical protein